MAIRQVEGRSAQLLREAGALLMGAQEAVSGCRPDALCKNPMDSEGDEYVTRDTAPSVAFATAIR
jgi:hypothetical protein